MLEIRRMQLILAVSKRSTGRCGNIYLVFIHQN